MPCMGAYQLHRREKHIQAWIEGTAALCPNNIGCP